MLLQIYVESSASPILSHADDGRGHALRLWRDSALGSRFVLPISVPVEDHLDETLFTLIIKMSEKSSSLPFSLPDHAHRQRRTAMKVYKRGAKATLALLTGICAFGLLDSHLDLGNSADTYILGPVDDALGRWLHLSSPSFPADESSNSLCPQVPAYTGKLIDFHSEPSIETLAARLGGAVRVDTSVEDDWPSVDEDPGRWEAIFGPFRKYLEETFPRVHGDERVSREVVNGHGLLFIWKGKEEGSKPLVLTAHQGECAIKPCPGMLPSFVSRGSLFPASIVSSDVVPVNPTTVDEWVYPPFSGYFNSSTGLIWGRGASDDKGESSSRLSFGRTGRTLLTRFALFYRAISSFLDLYSFSARGAPRFFQGRIRVETHRSCLARFRRGGT